MEIVTPATYTTLQNIPSSCIRLVAFPLPERTYILAGGARVFAGDISAFYEKARRAGTELGLKVPENLVRDLRVVERTMGSGFE